MSDAESIFHAARQKPSTAERDAFLAAACGDDLDLRGRVEWLLAAAPEVGSFLEPPADKTGSYPADADDRRGEPVGPYKLLQLLGEGGMGEVWMAEQAEPVKRRVAVKLIKPGMDSRQVIARFEAERQALALMDHPNIAKVFDAGTTAAGRPYFVMELVKGVPLTRYCDDNHLTPRERLELFVPVCQAVQHAHQKGVIHRDLKPSNVLVALYDGRPVPKVIDFGVAKALHQNLTERTMFTEVGAIVGTLEYMSPEQAEVNNLDIDTRSDVYSLGVILYELLTGSRPLDAQRLRSAGFAEMLRIIREEEPPKPSTRLSGSGDRLPGISAQRRTEPRKLSRLVQGDLDWIVMKALEKDRGRRYETANGFAADVQRYLADEPVQAGPPGALYRLTKFARRHRGAWIATTLVLLALQAGLMLALVGLVEARRQERRAIAATDHKEAERARADEAAAAERLARQQSEKRLAQIGRANDVLASIFKDLNPRAAEKDGKPLQALLGEQLDRATAQLDGDAIGDPLTVARLQMALGQSLVGLGFPEKAVALFAKAHQTLLKHHGVDHDDTLSALSGLAQSHNATGNVAAALPLLEEAHRRMTAKFGPDRLATLQAANNLALAHRESGRLDLAQPLYEEAHRRMEATLGPDHAETLTCASNLADCYFAARRFDVALRMYEETLRRRRERFGPDHPQTLASLNDLAVTYRDTGRIDAALPLLEEALRLTKAKLGPDHPHTLNGMGNLGECYRRLGRIADALPLLEETLRLQRARPSADHLDMLSLLNNLALAYRAVGRSDAMLAHFEDARRLAAAKLGRDNPDTLQVTYSLAEAFVAAGLGRDARPHFETVVAARRIQLGANDRRFAGVLAHVSRELLAAGEYAAAETYLRECLTVRQTTAPDDWTTFHTQSALGGSLLGQRKFAEAEPLLTAGYDGMKRRIDRIAMADRTRVADAAGRLVQLCEATGKADDAAKWLDELWAWAETPTGN